MSFPRLLRRFAYFLLGLALLLAGLFWLSGSEWALRRMAQGVEAVSGGQIVLTDVHGSLYGPLKIGTLVATSKDWRIEARGLALDWQPRELLQRRLALTRVDLAELEVREYPSDTPLRPPESLRLPFALSVPQVRIGHLALQLIGSSMALRDIHFSLDKPAAQYRLALHGLDSPWGGLTGQLNLADAPPFALAGRAELDRQAHYRLHAEAAGTLRRIVLKGLAQAPMQIDLEATLTPFERIPLDALRLAAAGLNPRDWQPEWPQAELQVRADLQGTEGGRLAGRLEVDNTAPGSLDRGRIPLYKLAGQVAGTPDDLAFEALLLDLGRGGQLRGGGRFQAGWLQLTLNTSNLDPHALHSPLRPMRLAGALALTAEDQVQRLQAGFAHGRYRLELDATRRGADLKIAAARLSAGRGRLDLTGGLGLAAPYRFDLRGELQSFDPAGFGDYPAADLNAHLATTGQLSPQPTGTLTFGLAPSRFRGQPLSGEGRLRLTPGRIEDGDLALQLGGNRLALRGAYGAPGDRLHWTLEADNLAMLDPRLAGRIEAQGSLHGDLAEPAGEFKIQAGAMRRGKEYRLAGLHAEGRLEQGLQGPLSLQARLDGLRTPDIEVAQAEVEGRGQRSAHSLKGSARGEGFDLRVELAGAWGETWSGEVRSLENRGRHPLKLRAPARLEAGTQSVILSGAALDYAGIRLSVEELAWRSGLWRSRGNLQGLRPADLAGLWTLPGGWESDLLLAGEWSLEAGEQLAGHAALWRERGDLVALTEPKTALGLDRLRLDVRAGAGRIRGELEAGGSTLGRMHIRAESSPVRREGIWGLPGSAPLDGAAEVDLPRLAWLAPLLDSGGRLNLGGSAAARLSLGGSVGSPRLSGTLEADRLRLEWPEAGLHLRQGSLRAELHQDEVRLTRLVLYGGEGRIEAQGSGDWKGSEPRLDLDLKAEALEVLTRPDRQLVVSGDGRVSARGKAVQMQGRLKAERALIELPKADTPTRSEDVVVLGRTATAPPSAPFAVGLDVRLDLGERFFIKGRGLDARLAGVLQVKAAPRAYPRVGGSVRVAKGTYTAYGQRLEIERGILDFQGPLENPGLDILAMRKNQEVEAGIAVTGTALAPRARLYSRPTVPDGEKLAWLVLGRGMDSAGGSDLDLLGAAAGTLLARGESVTLQERIAQTARLDEVGLRGAGTLENTVLTLGKRISKRAYLSYEQGLTGVGGLVKLNYTLSPRWSVQTQTGAASAVDLFFTLSFD